jgi:hypothetical protein
MISRALSRANETVQFQNQLAAFDCQCSASSFTSYFCTKPRQNRRIDLHAESTIGREEPSKMMSKWQCSLDK